MSILTAIQENHFEGLKRHPKWGYTYWFIDLHGTVIVPTYIRDGEIPKEFYPYAKFALQEMTKRKDIFLVMYTCSHPSEIEIYKKFFAENEIVFDAVNRNPEMEDQNEGHGYYADKPYMNVLFDDKAGFRPSSWFSVLRMLKFDEIVNGLQKV